MGPETLNCKVDVAGEHGREEGREFFFLKQG